MFITKKYLITLFLIILTGLTSVLYLEYFYRPISNNFDVIDIVKNRNIDELEFHYSNLIMEYQTGAKDELVLYRFFEAFKSSGTIFESNLHDWLEMYPDSIAAKLALGHYYLHIGWLSRGTRWRKDTNVEQIGNMSQNFNLAHKYYLEVVHQDPSMILAYEGMMSIAMAMGDDKLKSDVTKQALDVHPDSYVFNFKRLFAMQPKWGGSIEEINRAIDSIEPLFSKNMNLELLEGFETYAVVNEMTRMKSGKETCALVLPVLDRAIELYPDEYLYIRRAEIYRCMLEYEESIANYDMALHMSSDNYDSYIGRGYTYFYMHEYKKSIDDLNLAILLDELNPKANRYRGMSHYYSNKYNEAIVDFKTSLIYEPYNSYVHKMLGYLNYNQIKDYVKAEEEFDMAIQYGDKKPKTLLMLISAQHRQKDCKFIPTAKKFIELCKDNESCNVKDISWATNSIMHVQREGTCKSIEN